jgi:hypothetical protein
MSILLATTIEGLWKLCCGNKWLNGFANPLLMFLPYVFPNLGFLSDIWKLVDLNSGLGVCYSIDLAMGNIGYMHEFLAHLLFIYGGLVDFEVI